MASVVAVLVPVRVRGLFVLVPVGGLHLARDVAIKRCVIILRLF